MMKMDGRDSAEYRIWEKMDKMVILEFDFKSLNDKIVNSASSPSLNQRQKRESQGRGDAVGGEDENGGSRERVSDFYLEIHTIQPSAVFGPRRKNVLRGAGYAWTSDL